MKRLICVAVAVTAWFTSSAVPVHAQAATTVAWDSVQINEMLMTYRTAGEGEPLLLLHGFTGTGEMWASVLDELAPHFRLIVPDLRGHGRSTNPSDTFTHRQAALDVFALMDHLGINRVKAMGISTGGMTLLHMATSQPERIDAMVLIGSTSYFPEQAREIMRSSHPDSIPPEALERMGRLHRGGATQVRSLMRQFHAFKDSYQDMNFTPPQLSTITARTLVVHGDRDMFFPVEIPVEQYRAIPRSYLWIVPNGSHVPLLGTESGEEVFIDAALSFLAGDWEGASGTPAPRL